MKKQYYKFISYSTVAVLFGLLFLGLIHTGANANSTNDLPPRPPGVPTPEQPAQPEEPPAPPLQGGFILLNMATPSPEYWVTVQWYDGQENWHTVSGWQGNFDGHGDVLWWVAPEDMGKGPFRWVVLSSEVDGRPIAISEEFYLPEHTLQTVRVEVSIQE
jgi:hypothetical protein